MKNLFKHKTGITTYPLLEVYFPYKQGRLKKS
nr:MAG TPA: hypothetical protein [Inoviridae sp.]DAX87822.1 MAG TPA: hypothetical protein [Inoviridae sp.]